MRRAEKVVECAPVPSSYRKTCLAHKAAAVACGVAATVAVAACGELAKSAGDCVDEIRISSDESYRLYKAKYGIKSGCMTAKQFTYYLDCYRGSVEEENDWLEARGIKR